jgi:hypothetical protein
MSPFSRKKVYGGERNPHRGLPALAGRGMGGCCAAATALKVTKSTIVVEQMTFNMSYSQAIRPAEDLRASIAAGVAGTGSF